MTTLTRPPYSSATHSQPAINVNLKQCTSVCSATRASMGGPHLHTCEASTVLIPCPIPRSVTFEVVLGECNALSCLSPPRRHLPHCPARPVKVSCSISGKTWEESEVWLMDDFEHAAHFHPLLTACRERWALVKALVLGRYTVDGDLDTIPTSLMKQRDAVYAALADMARQEVGTFDAQERAIRAMGEPTFMPDNFMRAEPRASASILERYVERLIEQVGILGVAP